MLPIRGARGYRVYAAGMEASAADKAKLLRFVRPGVIADLGCGTGTVLELLRRNSPRSRLIGVDCSPEMIRRCRRRFPGVELRREDITRPLFEPESVDTIVLCSILHEVFSYKGYDHSAVRRTLAHCAAALRQGGRLILRDGVKPVRRDAVSLTFLNSVAYDKFVRFCREFGPGEIVWKQKDGRIQVARREAMEFLTKYIYDVNWRFEVKEQFGVFTLSDWAVELQKAGLRVLHRESYLIPWLRETHWSRDVVMEVRTRRGYRRTEYPHSTMLVAAGK